MLLMVVRTTAASRPWREETVPECLSVSFLYLTVFPCVHFTFMYISVFPLLSLTPLDHYFVLRHSVYFFKGCSLSMYLTTHHLYS